jgi:hypothetical protein
MNTNQKTRSPTGSQTGSLKKSVGQMLLSVCPYTHLWRVIKTSIAERKLPAATRQGAFITLLGIFCPIFWVALFTGASASELKFHAIHSGIVVLIGVVLMISGLMKK